MVISLTSKKILIRKFTNLYKSRSKKYEIELLKVRLKIYFKNDCKIHKKFQPTSRGQEIEFKEMVTSTEKEVEFNQIVKDILEEGKKIYVYENKKRA